MSCPQNWHKFKNRRTLSVDEDVGQCASSHPLLTGVQISKTILESSLTLGPP